MEGGQWCGAAAVVCFGWRDIVPLRACHQSPHAMVPSREASDNYQALQYRGKAVTIGICAACHDGSRGEGSAEFAETHGAGGGASACNVCHTRTPATTALWPHGFQWESRGED